MNSPLNTRNINLEIKATTNMASWGDMVYDSDVQKDARFVNMSPEDWRQLIKQHLATCNDLKRAMAWVENIESKRTRSVHVDDDVEAEYESTLRLLADMVAEPSKYGDDIEMVLDLERELLQGPARWRVAAIWAQDEQNQQTRLGNRAATKIQAIVRGMLTRKHMPNTDCARCLAHVLCVGEMCIDCLDELNEEYNNAQVVDYDDGKCDRCYAPSDWDDPGGDDYDQCPDCGAPTA